ncbi:hypothetical protein DOE76_13635 [Leifsonia sp. ku-ls]|jgi:hypothetical protein|nr:hypothetical protein DOE76_13635 [Leifsonia sp. ku-ls]
MKHVTYAEKSLLIGDEAADLLMSYATVLGRTAGADAVTIAAIGADGNDVEATFLLNPSTVLMVESANTNASEPENETAVDYLRHRIRTLTEPFELEGDSEPFEH